MSFGAKLSGLRGVGVKNADDVLNGTSNDRKGIEPRKSLRGNSKTATRITLVCGYTNTMCGAKFIIHISVALYDIEPPLI